MSLWARGRRWWAGGAGRDGGIGMRRAGQGACRVQMQEGAQAAFASARASRASVASRLETSRACKGPPWLRLGHAEFMDRGLHSMTLGTREEAVFDGRGALLVQLALVAR